MRGRTAFLDYLAHERRLSPNTVAAYRRDMRRFFGWLAGRRESGRLANHEAGVEEIPWSPGRRGKRDKEQA